MKTVEYKFIEAMPVTDDVLTDVVNTWVRKGWVFDSFQFAMSASSKRPSMAFVGFSRQVDAIDEPEDPPRDETDGDGGDDA